MNKNIKPYYENEIKKITDKLNKYNNCFRFAVAADSHLDNSLADTLNNIHAVDKECEFEFLIHLGDFLNGNFSRQYTKQILHEQMELFKECTSSGKFYPVQGNHDGFVDKHSQFNVNDIALDEDWYEATSFVDKYENAVREKNKPYFFIDYPKEKIRLVVICSFHYNEFQNTSNFQKQYGIDTKQIEWLKNSALKADKDWTIMLFSHDTPFSQFNENACIDNPRVNGNLVMETIHQAQKENGFSLAGWFIGHFHGDYIGKVNGINFILVASETAYVPSLWDMPENGYYPARKCNSAIEDLWDAVVLDKENRKLKLFRFGAGIDREIDY